jgi:glycosyltransferase involved in cell wall biosynthesis
VSGPPSAARTRTLSLGMLSTYPPTQCGLATFNAALWKQLDDGSGTVGVVRVVDRPETPPGPEVVGQLVNGSVTSAQRAVEQLNDFDAIVVQHEYGIYGGPDGGDVVALLAALTVPTIVVLHTVLQEPTHSQRRVLSQVLEHTDVAVTMTQTARRRVIDLYGADPESVRVIPHGAVRVEAVRQGRRRSSRPLVLTWGLLGPGKGIEWAVDAMAGLRDLNPRYLVLGRTHPKVLEHEGEHYRESLLRRASANGVLDLVELDDSYLSTPELAGLVASADVVLLPYDSREQVTSGVLVEAIAAGRPVVSTAFPHAVELLTDGPGLVVPQRDPVALEAALRRLLSEPGLAPRLARQAALKAPDLLWETVAGQYRRLAGSLVTDALATAS